VAYGLKFGGRKDRTGGVSSRTIGHARRILKKVVGEALKNDLITKNRSLSTCAESRGRGVGPPPRAHRSLYLCAAIVALVTGLRRGEILALRWSNVDLDTKVARVREALEETKKLGPRFKTPKTKNGVRESPCPTWWSKPFASIDAGSWSSGLPWASGSCQTMRWCSLARRALRSRRGIYLQIGRLKRTDRASGR
jgi:hypothetical protein